MLKKILVSFLILALLFGMAGAKPITLIASKTATVSSISDTFPVNPNMKGAVFTLKVSAASYVANDTLDIYLQHSTDGGTTWTDFGNMTRVLGNGGAVTSIGRWFRDMAPETELGAATNGTLAAGILQGPIGSAIRIYQKITDPVLPAANASFTYSMTMD